MAVTYKGVIAGIGSKQDNINVILPEFDARLRKFEVGKNTILEGFEYNSSTGYLSSGYCLVEGYVGGNKENIPIQESNYVYGVFTINHDKNIPDSFEIEIHDSPISNPQQDDILNTVGKYYYLIYPLYEVQIIDLPSRGTATIDFTVGVVKEIVVYTATGLQLRAFTATQTGSKIKLTNLTLTTYLSSQVFIYYSPWKYPAKAFHSDYATIVEEDGKLENGVTCPTQKVNDNSTKVANTEYVHNQIEEEIGYDKNNLSSEVLSEKGENKAEFTFEYVFKAKLCLLNITKKYEKIRDPSTVINTSIPAGTTIITLPNKLKPRKSFSFYIAQYGSSASSNTHLEQYTVQTNGNIIATKNCDTTSQIAFNIGYETN